MIQRKECVASVICRLNEFPAPLRVIPKSMREEDSSPKNAIIGSGTTMMSDLPCFF